MKICTKDHRCRFLLVEDNEASAAALIALLNAYASDEFEITRATTLAEAVAALSQQSFDLILLDLGLRDASCEEVMARIIGGELRTPVVVLTGHDEDEIGTRAMVLGAREFLVKGEMREPRLVIRILKNAINSQRYRNQRSDELDTLTKRLAAIQEQAHDQSSGQANLEASIAGVSLAIKQMRARER
jgi:DNA-binding NarL/FixJ family response regulator